MGEVSLEHIKQTLTNGLVEKLLKYNIPINIIEITIRKRNNDQRFDIGYNDNSLIVNIRINDLVLNRVMFNYNFNSWCKKEINNIFYLFYGDDLMEKNLLKVEDYKPQLPKCCKTTLLQKVKSFFKGLLK